MSLSKSVLRSMLVGFINAILFALPIKAQIVQRTMRAPNYNLPKFEMPESGLRLARRTQSGSFFDVIGRKSAVYGYEHRSFEAWVHPLKLIDDVRFTFAIEGYPLAYRAEDLLTNIEVRPEATTFYYSHAAFQVKQTIFAPVDEAGIIILLDVDTVLPMKIGVQFRPRLKLAWVGASATPNLEWNKDERLYFITEESRRFAGVIGSPFARDISVQPYQEEPRDVPAAFEIEVTPDKLKRQLIPVIIAGAATERTPPLVATTSPTATAASSNIATAREQAQATYNRLLDSIQKLYRDNVSYYQKLQNETLNIESPDARFNETFAWAKAGTDKGFATNPFLGTGLVAGFRTSGESERAGFAWFFGRDALWTALALNSYGDFAGTRIALDFLRKFQRADGKIPHEISQSATFVDWFNDYPYAWASADATPLYVILHHDLWSATGDKNYLTTNWDSIKNAYRYTSATDTDNNGLIENTKFGHGWVEGGALYPPHEELYMQGLFIEASRTIAELADAMNDKTLATDARSRGERTRKATEETYWLNDKNFYAFATQLPTVTAKQAEPGANLNIRQTRLEELKNKTLIDEDTVLPAVPLWWKTLDKDRAQQQIDRLGSNEIATDWGARIISNKSRSYDSLSYHYGSVWGLFTGWASLAAYNYGRPHTGLQALYANMNLTYTNALGYVTELLSGDFQTPFGRSSHHQVWSEAMVITPAVRGLLGLSVVDAGTTLRFAPQTPADWNDLQVRRVRFNSRFYDFKIRREPNSLTLSVNPSATNEAVNVRANIVFAPALPLDAVMREVTVDGKPARYDSVREGDVQRVVVSVNQAAKTIQFKFDDGTDVFMSHPPLVAGARSSGLRIIRVRPDETTLRLTLEGVRHQTYTIGVRTPHTIGALPIGVTLNKLDATNNLIKQLSIKFEGATNEYARREIVIPLQRANRNR